MNRGRGKNTKSEEEGENSRRLFAVRSRLFSCFFPNLLYRLINNRITLCNN